MPSYGTFPVTSSPEMNAVQPTVSIAGSIYDFCTCISIEDNAGIIPSKAFVRIGGNNYDLTGNITLNAFNWQDIRHGARVRIENGYDTLFLGQLIKRRDRGQSNSVIWEAWDDRWLLSKIPVRGCLVWDPIAGVVKHIPRYVCRVSPNGMRNCIGVAIPGIAGGSIIPVFTHLPEAHAGWDDSDTDTTLALGKISAWTPSKFLLYLCALANLTPSSGVPGVYSDTWRSIGGSSRIMWNTQSCQFPSDPRQSMDKKLPDHTFQAASLLKCIDDVCKISGTYGLRLNYGLDATGIVKSQVTFFPRDRSINSAGIPNSSSSGGGKVILLQRGGAAADIRTAHDFELEEDSSDVFESALVEGKSVYVESNWFYTGNANDPLQPVWTADEAAEFQNIVNGAGGNGIYARFPLRQPDNTTGETWASVPHANADGTTNGGIAYPFANINSDEAISLARHILPRPFRCFQINSNTSASILAGNGSKYGDTTKYPFLSTQRQIISTQLQYYLDDPVKKSRVCLPVRIQVKDHSGTTWHEVNSNHGLRVTFDGYIWLDGLTDEHAGSDAVYTGSLYSPNASVTVRDIKINAAAPLDVRKFALANDSANQLDSALAGDLGGGMMLYIDSPEGFVEEHQVNSEPAATTTFLAGNPPVRISTPIGRIITDDGARISTHAARRVREKKFVKRTSRWSLPGIRIEWRAGQYIDKIQVTGQSGDADYLIQSPIESVVYDFMTQQTHIGGLVQS